jgi:hypothetical protein
MVPGIAPASLNARYSATSGMNILNTINKPDKK